MNSERIKEIQEQTAYPESVSVKQALLQVWNECQQENNKDIAFAEWTQLKGWGLLSKNKWINKNSEVVSSEVLFDMYSNQAE